MPDPEPPTRARGVRLPPADPPHGDQRHAAPHGATAPARDEASSAQAIVAALWRAAPPGTIAQAAGPVDLRRALAARLAKVAAAGRRLGAAAALPDVGRGVVLLAETAEVLCDAIADPAAADRHQSPHPAASWPDRLRLARLERWLAARAASEPEAAPAADLCMWLLEHLEASGR